MGMINIPLFLGYWGDGDRHNLEGLLNQAISYNSLGKNIQKIPLTATNSEPFGNIICISAIENGGFAGKFSLSAAGLGNGDIWVSWSEENCLVLGREAFGRMQLYWLKLGEVIWFASRLQLLLPILENPQINIAGLYGYSCFSYVPNPLTPITDIHTIPAGTELMWQFDCHLQVINAPISRRLHEWEAAKFKVTDEKTAITQLQTLLKDAVHRQIEDLPTEAVGVFLSGGLDSSIVAALLVNAGVKVRAYALDFGELGVSEYSYAQQVADFLQIPLVRVPATPNRIRSAIISTVQALDLPFGDGVTVPLYLLNQAASQETEVVFNGEGGDQLFAGWTNKPLIAASIYGENDFTQVYLRTFHRLWGYEAQVFSPDVYQQVQHLAPETWLQSALDPNFCQSLLDRLRRGSLMLKGAQNIHPRATNLGFYHGLKVRSLFCDMALAEWTFSLPGELCLQGSCEKYILKRAVENWLPSEIVWRRKRGMGVPLTAWCLNHFWSELGVWLNPGRLDTGKCFYPEIAAKIASGQLGANIQGRRIGESLWLLIMWELWRIHVLGEISGKISKNHPFVLPRWLWKVWQGLQV